jgi:hypothetical protein
MTQDAAEKKKILQQSRSDIKQTLLMYPDLNDWVSLGSVLNRLAKPLLPRYEMWFEASAPHRVVRYEGAFGPPGAPEVVLELL